MEVESCFHLRAIPVELLNGLFGDKGERASCINAKDDVDYSWTVFSDQSDRHRDKHPKVVNDQLVLELGLFRSDFEVVLADGFGHNIEQNFVFRSLTAMSLLAIFRGVLAERDSVFSAKRRRRAIRINNLIIIIK